MARIADGRLAGSTRPSEYYTLPRRRNLSTAVIHKPTLPATQHCGHGRAVVRSVCSLGGAAAYICRDCYRQLTAAEARAVLVSKFNALFRGLRLRVFGPGGADLDDVVDCLICGRPLADNWIVHTERCDCCFRYRPDPPPYRIPPEADRRDRRPRQPESDTGRRRAYVRAA